MKKDRLNKFYNLTNYNESDNKKIFFNENKQLTYDDVIKQQQIGNPYSDELFSSKNSLFVEEVVDIELLREKNNFSNDDEIEHTVSYFKELGLDEDYIISRKIMDKIVDGIKLTPIVVDEEYKILDGSHRLAAYSELYYYYSNDFSFNGKLKIYKRISN